MEEEKQLEPVEERQMVAQRMAERTGENINTFTIMPTITVFNSSKTGDSDFQLGDIIKSIKTEAGYKSEKYENPFSGIIIKVRMFLKLKFKYAEGKPAIITNEFDSYSENELITVKQQDEDDKFQPVFIGNYAQVNDKYSLKSDTEVEKKLELHHSIYVLRDIESKEIIRIDCKGLSRSNFFDYMKSFSRRNGDFMSGVETIFGSEISDTDFRGKPRQLPVAGMTFTKGGTLPLEKLNRVEEIQIAFIKELTERDKMFGTPKKEDVAQIEQPAPKDEIPTIQLDEEDEVKIEDVPF